MIGFQDLYKEYNENIRDSYRENTSLDSPQIPLLKYNENTY